MADDLQSRGENRPRVVVPPEYWEDAEVFLPPQETRHLGLVLRLAPGALVEVTDGQGRDWEARIIALAGGQASLALVRELSRPVESPLHICLGLGLARAEVFDLAIRQATEMGVNQVLPFLSSRALVRPAAWGQARRQRWQRLAQASLKSSQRRVLPQVSAPLEFAEVLRGPEPLKILCWEEARAAGRDLWASGSPPQGVRLLIGPEGGFSQTEVQQAQEEGFALLGLGPRRLRYETAVLAALTLIQSVWGDLCPQPPPCRGIAASAHT